MGAPGIAGEHTEGEINKVPNQRHTWALWELPPRLGNNAKESCRTGEQFCAKTVAPHEVTKNDVANLSHFCLVPRFPQAKIRASFRNLTLLQSDQGGKAQICLTHSGKDKELQ